MEEMERMFNSEDDCMFVIILIGMEFVKKKTVKIQKKRVDKVIGFLFDAYFWCFWYIWDVLFMWENKEVR